MKGKEPNEPIFENSDETKTRKHLTNERKKQVIVGTRECNSNFKVSRKTILGNLKFNE